MIEWLTNFIFETLLQEVIAVIAGIGFVLLIQNQWIKLKYGGWKVEIWKKGACKLSREISPEKLKEIQSEAAELAVFLKGVASPYGWFNCDIIADGETLGLLTIQQQSKKYIIDFDKNPSQEPKKFDDLTQAFAQDVMDLMKKHGISGQLETK